MQKNFCSTNPDNVLFYPFRSVEVAVLVALDSLPCYVHNNVAMEEPTEERIAKLVSSVG